MLTDIRYERLKYKPHLKDSLQEHSPTNMRSHAEARSIFFKHQHDGKAFEKGFADCKSWRLPESRFTIVDGESVFHHSWEKGIPTERNCLSYYVVALNLRFRYRSDLKTPVQTACTPKTSSEISGDAVLLRTSACCSSYGSFDFSLQVRFRNDQENFRHARYTDEHMARQGVQIDAYKLLLPNDQAAGRAASLLGPMQLGHQHLFCPSRHLALTQRMPRKC